MRTWRYTAWAVGVGVAIALLLRLPFLTDQPSLYVSDLSQLLAAGAAAVAGAFAARRTSGSRRRSWVWLSVGTGAWAAGQAVWSWYELVLGRDVPFPSLADLGFLVFPVAMAVSLVIWLSSQGGRLAARGRDLLDGSIIATSLLAISWVTTLSSVAVAGGESWFPLAVSLAYPIGDLVVATLILMALARGPRDEQRTLVVLTLGLGGLAVADSAYVYLNQVGSYTSANAVSSGWVIGFLLVGAAAMGTQASPAAVAVTPSSTLAQATPLQLMLPYLPLLTAGVVLFAWLLDPDTEPLPGLVLGVVLVLLVLARQFLGLLENHELLTALRGARDQLQHQATHDELTGLANRGLFTTRLHEALEQPAADVSVLFCDLDDFKLVNDQRGHIIGDRVLVVVAQRLLQCVRGSDTVARLGGDEFAILVTSDQAVAVGQRIVEVLAHPIEVQGELLTASISVGVARHRADLGPRAVGDAESDPDELAMLMLREADIAMYAAKGAGKGRVAFGVPPAVDDEATSSLDDDWESMGQQTVG